MLDEIMFALVTVVVLAAAAIGRPSRAQCPPGWGNDGVRSSGEFACRRDLVGDDLRYAVPPSTARRPPGELHGRIYCEAGALPIVVDDRTVRCKTGARHQWR